MKKRGAHRQLFRSGSQRRHGLNMNERKLSSRSVLAPAGDAVLSPGETCSEPLLIKHVLEENLPSGVASRAWSVPCGSEAQGCLK